MRDVTINQTSVTGRIGPARDRQPTPGGEEGQPRPVGGKDLPATVLEQPTVPDLPKLEKLRDELARFVKSINRDLQFRVDDASGRTVVTVLDGETQEVIRQVPSEELLRMARTHAATGAVLFDGEG